MKFFKPFLLLTTLLFLAWIFYQPETRSALLKAAAWAETEPVLAAPLYILFLILAVVLMFPVWGVLMIGGYLFGFVTAVILVWVGYQIGAFLAFLFARTIGRNWVKSKFSKNMKFRNFEEGLNNNGFKAILFARLSFVFPTNILNLIAGISSISSRHFITATAFGSIPMVLVYTFIGSKSSNLIESITNGTFEAPTLSPGVIVVLALLAFCVFAFIILRSKSKTNQ